VAAELIKTTRLYGRGLAQIDPKWIPDVAGHLLKRQLLDPHWEKTPAEVVALERATLYGLVVYNQRRVNYGRVDPAAAREIFIRSALVEGQWETRLPFLAHNRKLVAQVQELEHKARRQDVLVDDELIYAYYDRHLPQHVCSGISFERWYREASRGQAKLLHLSRDELMRHEAAGITTASFPRAIRLGGVDCGAAYLHEPGDPRDGLTVTVPVYALNQVSDERCEWLVPGMLVAKVTALLKSLHQKPRARLVPLPEFAAAFVERVPFGDGGLVEALLQAVRERTQLPVQRADFKLDMLAPHHFMNLRVVDEHGRQLGMGRNPAALKAELGGLARSAFQALAVLKLPGGGAVGAAAAPRVAPASETASSADAPVGLRGAAAHAAPAGSIDAQVAPAYVAWTFGELPELMEIRKGGQVLVGFPALVDKGAHVEIEVFDEPDAATRRHREGMRRLVALAMKEPLKYLERHVPDLQKMAVAYMSLGTAEELRTQIVEVALDRAFLAEPLPTDEAVFSERLELGRGRLMLIAQEVARLVAQVLQEYNAVTRKLKDTRPPKEVAEDIQAQLQRLCPKRFVVQSPWSQLQHFPRYLKAMALRLDKLRADPARDAQRMAELRPLEQRYQRRLAELKGRSDARMDEYRWLLEELRVSAFAQELRTPQPVSGKRLEKVWQQICA